MGEGPRGIGLRGGPLLLSQLETGLRKCGTRGSQGTAWRDGHRVPADEATGAPEKLPSSPHACRAMRPLGRSLRGLREDPPRYLSATSGSLRLPSAAHVHLEASTSEMLPISQCRKCKAKKKLFLEPARVRSHGRPGDAVLEKRDCCQQCSASKGGWNHGTSTPESRPCSLLISFRCLSLAELKEAKGKAARVMQ